MGVATLSARAVWRAIKSVRRSFSPSRWRWLLAGCWLGGIVLTASLGLHLPWRHRLELRVSAEANPHSRGREVGVLAVSPSGPVSFDVLARHGPWVVKDKVLTSMAPGAFLSWQGRAEADSQVVFVSQPWSGRVEISWDGHAETVDLYSPDSTQHVVALSPQTPSQRMATALFCLACSVAMGWLLLVAVLLGSGIRTDESPGLKGRWTWIGYALPCVLVWSAYLLAFWPGVMTPDSIDQWAQVTRGIFINNHPVFHTRTNAVFIHFFHSPAAVAAAQIIALAVVFGLTVRELEAWRVPTWARWALTLAFALSPANGILSVTLWKDVFYSIAMLGLGALMLRIVLTSGECFRKRSFAGAFVFTACCVCLYRHNGVLVVGLLAITVPFCIPRGLRRRAFGLTASAVVTFAVITGPAYRIAGMHPMGKLFALQVQMHQLGAIIASDPALPPKAHALLERVEPLEAWRSGYLCYSVNGVIYNAKVNGAFVETHASEILRTWLSLVPSHWRTLLAHQLCVTSLIWRIHPPASAYLYTYSDRIEPNAFGLVQASKWPTLGSFLDRLLGRSMDSAFVDWVWRPATYLFVLLLAGTILALRLRQAQALLTIAPAAYNALVLMGINLCQDFRYEYPVFIAGLVFAPLMLARARPRRAEASAPAAPAGGAPEIPGAHSSPGLLTAASGR